MPMKNPPHPGRSIKTACLEPLGLSITEGAKVLGVTRQTLTKVINGKIVGNLHVKPRFRAATECFG